jgi:hypothetical protein
MLPQNSRQSRGPIDLVTLPSGHKVPAYTLRISDMSSSNRGLFEKLPAVSGSIAGANSRFLDDYKKHAEKEKRRLARMDAEEISQIEKVEFDRQREERKRALEEEAAKKREKRQKRKLGKSSDGLPLPVEIVSKLKEAELLERKSTIPEKRTVHPYAMNPPASQLSKEVEVKKLSNQITILDDDN